MAEIKVLGLRLSPFHQRVEIALKIKGVEYEYVAEDILKNKSEQLLMLNPIYKKIPVFIHNDKAMPESLVILEYIDETWKANPLLPIDPHQKAQARFWANFIDDKLGPACRTALVTGGEEGDKAGEEAEELLRVLENEIRGGNKLFEAKGIGFMELAGILTAYWLPIFQEVAGKELMTKDKYPAVWDCLNASWTSLLFSKTCLLKMT
uniref:Glutathione S-transferase n=1 Tax=Opuntia streptacantha TaxID=393608 RepID=A0A7C8YXJ9_OPUST